MIDWGIYVLNVVVLRNSNGLFDVMDNYDKVKEFFVINLDVFIIVVSFKYFGMDNIYL